MARIEIFDTAPKKWFPYDSDTEVLIEYVDKAALTKLVRSADDAAKKLKEDHNIVLDLFLGKKAVHDWRKISDHTHPGLCLPNGDQIAFNGDNRNMLMRRSSSFAGFVLAKSTTAAGFLEQEEPTLGDDKETLDKLMEEFSEGEGEPKNG